MLHPGHLGRLEEWTARWRDQVRLLRQVEIPGLVAVRGGFVGPLPHAAGPSRRVDGHAVPRHGVGRRRLPRPVGPVAPRPRTGAAPPRPGAGGRRPRPAPQRRRHGRAAGRPPRREAGQHPRPPRGRHRAGRPGQRAGTGRRPRPGQPGRNRRLHRPRGPRRRSVRFCRRPLLTRRRGLLPADGRGAGGPARARRAPPAPPGCTLRPRSGRPRRPHRHHARPRSRPEARVPGQLGGPAPSQQPGRPVGRAPDPAAGARPQPVGAAGPGRRPGDPHAPALGRRCRRRSRRLHA